MIWIRILILLLSIYYVMVIFQMLTEITWTSSKITFLKFICPFYFWVELLISKNNDSSSNKNDDSFKNVKML